MIDDFKFFIDENDAKEYPESYIMIADFKNRKVMTNCGDYYYDLEIDFDDFFKFAKYVEEQDKIYNKRKETK